MIFAYHFLCTEATPRRLRSTALVVVLKYLRHPKTPGLDSDLPNPIGVPNLLEMSKILLFNWLDLTKARSELKVMFKRF